MSTLAMVRPTVAEALTLLGRLVVCTVGLQDGEGAHYTKPSWDAGVVVSAPGGVIEAHMLLVQEGEELPFDGYHYELFLSDIRHIRPIDDGVGTGTVASG